MNKFTELLRTVEEVSEIAYKNVDKLKDELRTAEHDLEHKQREVTRFKKIKQMAGWDKVSSAYNWSVQDFGANEYCKIAWSQTLRFQTTMLEFCISIKEVTDLKKMKWTVNISGCHKTLSTADYRADYSDYDYIKDKYMASKYNTGRVWFPSLEKGNLEVSKKFKSQSEASEFMIDWKNRLYNDHIGEIEYEMELVKAIKEVE